MGEKLIVAPINQGFRSDRIAVVIDNDSFPTLINAYQWRGRVKRKRGTSLLGRLQRFFNSASTTFNSGSTTIALDGSGNGNILTGFSLQANGNIVPTSVTTTDTVSLISYTDPSGTGVLSPSGTINYATGDITIAAAAGHTITASFFYYPDLPVMGLEETIFNATQFPGELAFDTTYSYNISTSFSKIIYDVSFYKNLQTATYPGYIQKTNWTPTSWNGQDYQQFWSTNYQGAFWVTNGIDVPFTGTSIGMQYAGPATTPQLTAATRTSATTMDFTIVGNPLVVGDFVFANEFTASAGGDATALNFQTGFVTSAGNTFTVKFPNANIPAGTYTPGILQYLTNRSDVTKDCIRWYDGDPTDGTNANPTNFVVGKGWVNFCPPLSQAGYSIDNETLNQYYLVGARMIVPFKDRLLFLGPVIQTSGGSKLYLQDTIIYSQNGTPYYTASFTGDIFNPTDPPGILSLLVPVNQTATPTAFWEDQTGFGGFQSAAVAQPIITVSANEDALILGFSSFQARMLYTGNDIQPFSIYIINSELGSQSTFSLINMDQGVITKGNRGFIITSQTSCQRIDLEIPDQAFELNLSNNGAERVTAQRDYINEWIYFTYPSNEFTYNYPNQTLIYNYRDQSWGIFNECYTTYGQFRESSGLTWNTLDPALTWETWNDPWYAGSTTLFQPEVIAGNQQGFVMIREDEQVSEGTSLYIQSFSGSTVTSPNHCLNTGDYIIISGCIGTIGAAVNGQIFSVANTTTNTFDLNPNIGSGTYLGGGLITRMYVPSIQTKQFPTSWQLARKTRIGSQQYLLSQTPGGQVNLLIFLSQNATFAYNDPNSVVNDSLIYSTTLHTCRESTNLGLTPANTNLQMLNSIGSDDSSTNPQQQIWHRMNTSLIGDTVQLGFTLSDALMRSFLPTSQSFTITGATQAYPCVLTSNNVLAAGEMVQITGVQGMTELNSNIYQVISANSTTVTINVDSTAFSIYTSGGTITIMEMPNQFEEIELHSFILDLTPSMVLA